MHFCDIPQHMFEQISGKSVQTNWIPFAEGGLRDSTPTPRVPSGLAALMLAMERIDTKVVFIVKDRLKKQ